MSHSMWLQARGATEQQQMSLEQGQRATTLSVSSVL